MRTFGLTTPMPAAPDRVWSALVTLEDWPRWNRLVPLAEGDVRVGEALSFQIRTEAGFRAHRPVVISLDPPREIVLAASFGHPWLVRLVHSFAIEDDDDGCSLHQSWTATGVLVPVLWPMLRRAMTRFSELGDDLATWTSSVHPD